MPAANFLYMYVSVSTQGGLASHGSPAHLKHAVWDKALDPGFRVEVVDRVRVASKELLDSHFFDPVLIHTTPQILDLLGQGQSAYGGLCVRILKQLATACQGLREAGKTLLLRYNWLIDEEDFCFVILLCSTVRH
jgi:hypothetical protein